MSGRARTELDGPALEGHRASFQVIQHQGVEVVAFEGAGGLDDAVARVRLEHDDHLGAGGNDEARAAVAKMYCRPPRGQQRPTVDPAPAPLPAARRAVAA